MTIEQENLTYCLSRAFKILMQANNDRLRAFTPSLFWLSATGDKIILMYEDYPVRQVIEQDNFSMIHCFFEETHLHLSGHSNSNVTAYLRIAAQHASTRSYPVTLMQEDITPHPMSWTSLGY